MSSARFDSAPPSVPPFLSARETDHALSRLAARLGSKLITSRDGCMPYQSDDTGVLGQADAVVLVERPLDIQITLEIAHETGLPVVPRAGGTGRTGGAVPIYGGVVLATSGLNQIKDIDSREGTCVVQPGVILSDLWDAVEAEGWFYPPDPNSSASCCLGGNVAENAAGPRAHKYGATRDYVLGVETFLPGGERIFSGRRTKKGVTGYDTTALLVGSEGTLALFGDLTLRLLPKPTHVITLLALFTSMHDVARAVEGIVQSGIVARCVEFLDDKTLQIMRDAGNAIDPRAGAMLLLEVDGDEELCLRQASVLAEICEKVGSQPVVVAQSENQRATLWGARKQMSHAVRKFAKHKLSEDVVVPRTQLGKLIEGVSELGDKHRIIALCYGHAGDGNLHVNFLWNEEDERARVEAAIVELFERTVALGGTLSGEHGIGLSKAPYLHLEQSAPHIALQKRLKSAFDPRGIMNPGKIFLSTGHGSC